MRYSVVGSWIGVAQGATAAIVTYNYVFTGGFGTTGSVGCLILILLYLTLLVLSTVEKAHKNVVGRVVFTNHILSKFLKDRDLHDTFKSFMEQEGLTYEIVEGENKNEM